MSESAEADTETPPITGSGGPSCTSDPETQHDDLLRHLHKAFALAIRSNATRLSDQFLDPFIDDLLLLDYKVEHAESEIEKRIILSALLPIKQRFKEIFDDFGHPDLQHQLDELLTRLGPLISRVPLKVGSWLFTIVRIDEADFRMKLVFEDNAEPDQIAAMACEKASERKLFTDTFNESLLKDKVMEVLGNGPPYTCLTLRASSNKYPISTAIRASEERASASDGHDSTSSESRASTVSSRGSAAPESRGPADDHATKSSDKPASASREHTTSSSEHPSAGSVRSASDGNSSMGSSASVDSAVTRNTPLNSSASASDNASTRSTVNRSTGNPSVGSSSENKTGSSGAEDTRTRHKHSSKPKQRPSRLDNESCHSMESFEHGGHHDESLGFANCVNCYRMRQEIQEDMLGALIQAANKMETRNNRILREIFNPL